MEKYSRYTLLNDFTSIRPCNFEGLLSQIAQVYNYEYHQNDTLGQIALRYLGSHQYFDIIAGVNNITDVFEPIEIGTILKIPSDDIIDLVNRRS